MDLMYLLHSLLRKKWIIILCSVLGLAAGFAFTLMQPRMYESVAQYSTGFTMENKISIERDESINFYEIDLRFNNVIESFKSPKVMGMLSYKLMLHDLESDRPFRHLKDEQKQKNEYVLVNLENARQLLRSKIADFELISPFNPEEKKVYDLLGLYGYDGWSLSGGLNFARVEKTDFINIYFRSENPELSAFVVNTIGQQFIRFFNSIYGVRSMESTAKLDSLVNQKKRVVDSLTTKLQAYRADIGTPNVADRASAAMAVVSELTSNYQQEQARLNTLRGELNAVETQLRNVTLQGSSGSTGTNNNPEILRLRKENANLEIDKVGKSDEEERKLQDKIDANMRRIQQLSAGVTPGNRTNVEKSQTRQTELVDKKIELEQQIIAAENNVKLFKEQKVQYEKMTATGGGDEVILRAKENELRIASQEYESLKKSLQSALDLDVNPENNFKQTLAGQPAYRPIDVKRSLILGLSGALMFFMSTFIILGLEFMDTSFKSPSIFQRSTKLRLLTSLNKIDLKKKQVSDYFHLNGELRKEDEMLYLENLRKLRYELETSGKKIFLVTSTKPGEGKSIVIESLANSLCLTKKRVLLVDANFSNNTLTRKFEAKPTLEQFSLNGQHNAVDKFWSITSMTSIPTTDMVGCSEGNHTPAEVLPKNNLLENLPRIADNYDFIFVEGAALNTHADSKELSKYVDGIIVVFSASSTLGPIDKESVLFLKTTGEKFMGSVLNNVELSSIKL